MSEIERRLQYLDMLKEGLEVLRPLVEECLDDDPAVRPSIIAVCERIQVIKDFYIKEPPQNIITLHQQVDQQKAENNQLRIDIEQSKREFAATNDQLRCENNQLKNHNDFLLSENERLKHQLVSLLALASLFCFVLFSD